MATIGFIGLGNMGSGMAANLVKAGHRVQAFDLAAPAVAAAVANGASAAADIAAAVAGVDFVITMLPAGKHVHAVYFDDGGVLAHCDPTTGLIDCSTIAVSEAREAAQKAAAAGYSMVDAPVSGGVAAATAGTLTFMVGGLPEAFERAREVLGPMGANIFHAGPAGNGQAAKVANNMLLGISMIATSEAFNLAARLGVDAQTFFDISSKASGQCWAMTSYCPAPGPVATAPANRDYQAGFTVAMMLKDLRLAQDSAHNSGAATALGKHAEEIYTALSDAGQAGLDFSVVMREVERQSGSQSP